MAPKVCFISPEYWPLTGGTGSYVYYLSNELLKNNYKIHVVTGSNQTCDVKVNSQLDVSFLKIPKMPVIKSFMLAGNSYLKLNSVRNSANVDIMHPQLPLTPSFAVPPHFGKALVCTVHSTWKGESEAIRGEPYSRLNANEKFLVSFNWFLRFFEEGILNRARKIIAVSHFTKWELTKYYKIPEGKIQVIHNGVDIRKFKPANNKPRIKSELGFKPDDILIVSVGRLYARKGLFTLIESMPTITKRFPKAKFVISGKGQSDEMNKLIAHADKLGVKNKIVFTGYYPDKKLPKLYQIADVFAFSTFYEHHPFAVLEALSTGLPVVTTTVGGIPETIDNGRNGFLVEPFNERQFADRILYLLEHPQEASNMGSLARKTVEDRFDWRIVVKDAIKVYEQALS
ncbi:MAG: glycosyltransferase family 4 protein [Candidatus Bathyarchaeota archaeon]|nr:glycosyltransferase family 4 protein [Candidatus Bathyarchaeota archaeon]MDD4326222.1 glycosyltransferase family 4 protein [Candidatus Bathyarchaeota archaeon]MDI9578037.1 glycosyltransferase family 4 protein [Thermoproteota archaeon]NLD66883.1 glycosyltransferase family 4 protein [Thermoproteota archaeon]